MRKSIAELNAMFEQEDELSLSDAHLYKSTAMQFVFTNVDVKAKMSASLKEAMKRPEVKLKNSISQKKSKSDPNVLAKISATQKKTSSKLEVKIKRSKAQKEAMNRPEIKIKKSMTLRHRLTDEQKKLYKQALEYGPTIKNDGKRTWLETAKKFGLNVNKLAMYGRNERLEDLQ